MFSWGWVGIASACYVRHVVGGGGTSTDAWCGLAEFAPTKRLKGRGG
jgi:hypothetical protein